MIESRQRLFVVAPITVLIHGVAGRASVMAACQVLDRLSRCTFRPMALCTRLLGMARRTSEPKAIRMVTVVKCHDLRIVVRGLKYHSVRFRDLALGFGFWYFLCFSRKSGLRPVAAPVALRVQTAFPVAIHAPPMICPFEAGLGKICILQGLLNCVTSPAGEDCAGEIVVVAQDAPT
jgi:hypothetical protein